MKLSAARFLPEAEVLFASATWVTVGLGGYWETTYTSPIVSPGPWGGSRWAVLLGGVWTNPTNATQVGGKIRLNYAGSAAAATRVRYTQPTPIVFAANGAGLFPFEEAT